MMKVLRIQLQISEVRLTIQVTCSPESAGELHLGPFGFLIELTIAIPELFEWYYVESGERRLLPLIQLLLSEGRLYLCGYLPHQVTTDKVEKHELRSPADVTMIYRIHRPRSCIPTYTEAAHVYSTRE